MNLKGLAVAVSSLTAVAIASCAKDAALPPAAAGAERRVVHTADLTAEVERIDEVEPKVRAVVSELGGLIVKSESYGADHAKTLTLTMRVPDAKLDAALTRLEGIARRVESRRVNGEDVTTEYVDLESQRTNLTAARDRLLALMERTNTATEALEVSRALEEVQGRLEQAQGRLTALSQSVTMSTIVATFVPRATSGLSDWSPLEVASSALVALGVVVKGAANVAIVLVVFAPLWVPVLVLLHRRRRVSASPARAP